MKVFSRTAVLLAGLASIPLVNAQSPKTDDEIKAEQSALQAEIDAMPTQVEVSLASRVDNLLDAKRSKEVKFVDKAGCEYSGVVQPNGPKPSDLRVYVGSTWCEATKTWNGLVHYEIPMGGKTAQIPKGTQFIAYRLNRNDERVN